ncbi:Formin-binding protein 4 like protein [Argiope bruennichi]|uniref:Formin-binding protein 4 like protein n=1 Tax=Argiope bruennichi TaxID=94029 RepID=A0A8T0FFY3_ARGBR|nr:Formin-binding protein 4 like protein [Argiope bruennichi]
MWKKLKGGRRQILQLEEKKRPKDSSKSKVKSLIHYSDSDDDSKKSNESESSSSSTAQTKNAAPLESQIADFFKEIDALSVPEEILKDTDKITSTCKTENVKDHTPKTCSSDAAVHLQASTYREDSHSVAPNTYCPWQEICDSSTGYNYYWNVQTNEVTWDCPPEYAAYVRSFNEVTEKAIPASQNDKNTDGTEKKKKNNIVVPEGAIIPISYFGDSSSSDNSSDSESEATNKNTKFEKLYEINKNKTVEKVDSTSKSNEAEVSEVKGPSFPHCYQFPHSESVKKETDSQMTISQNPVSEVVKIDSSLPLKTLNDITETPSQSILDELPAESSTHEASWKNSLKDAEKKSVQLNEKAGDESPDSSVNKEENSLSHNAYQVINNTYKSSKKAFVKSASPVSDVPNTSKNMVESTTSVGILQEAGVMKHDDAYGKTGVLHVIIDNSSGSRWILQCSPPPPPPDTPPPLPHTPPPESPPPPPKSPPPQPKSHPMPPPDSTETLREPEDMDIENSNDSSSFLFVTNRRIIDGKERGVDNKEGSTYYVNMAKIQLGLGLKKKNLPSLVEKWQKIKEEQIREDSIND